MIYLTGI